MPGKTGAKHSGLLFYTCLWGAIKIFYEASTLLYMFFLEKVIL